MKLSDYRFGRISLNERSFLYVVLGLLSGFILLTLFVSLLPPTWIDIEFSEEVQEHHNPLLDTLMKAVSWFGNGLTGGIVVILVSLYLYLSGYRREAAFTLATVLSVLVIFGLKAAINRPRPTTDLVAFVTEASYQSFPSGHVTFYVTFFGFLAFLSYRLPEVPDPVRLGTAIISVSLIFAVPFSRVYLGAHWFTDVVAGFFIGLLCLVCLIRTYNSDRFPGRKSLPHAEPTVP